MTKPQDILTFWFGENPEDLSEKSSLWWKNDMSLDQKIKIRFLETLIKAKNGQLESWKETADGTLAWIILLDQFSRNIYRNQPAAFAQDPLAQKACLIGIDHGFDVEIQEVRRVFFYMPLMHSEQWQHQEISLKLFRNLAGSSPPEHKKLLNNNYQFAIKHADIIRRFGRYPHRNEILGRVSTPEEVEFLKQPESSF